MKTKLLIVLLGTAFSCYVQRSDAQANTSLSNLVANNGVNQHLLPSANNTRDLGSAAKGWRYLYLSGRIYINGTLTMHATGSGSLFNGGSAGNTTLTGINSTGVGRFALNNLTSGNNNTAIGYASLYGNTSGYSNTACGAYALYDNTTGYQNTANGYTSMYSNSTGFYNTASGYRSLYSNNTGYRNTASGHQALYSNVSGDENTALGASSLEWNTTGYSNTATGNFSMHDNTTGHENTASGDVALNRNTSGSLNTANGYYALYYNTTGSYNSGYGCYAGYSTTTGLYNTAVGYQALSLNTIGSHNTAIGYDADVSANNLSNATAIGNNAVVNASNKVRVGDAAVTSIGGQVGWTNFSDGRYKKNIQENVAGLAFINMLRPVTYTVNTEGLNEYFRKGRKQNPDNADNKPDTVKAKALENAGKIVYTGLIAQEVEAAGKKLGFEFSGVDKPQTPDGLYGLRYDNFVAPLVKAVQELSRQNEELQTQINEMKTVMAGIKRGSAVSANEAAFMKGSLEQNVPNPFTKTTTIGYSLPQKFTSAEIVITDQNGKTLQRRAVTGIGKGNLAIDETALAAGAYNYSLFLDGKLISSKRMILTK